MTCKFCGAELPQGATFCPSCNKSQIEKIQAKPPRPWRRRAAYLTAAVVLLAVAALAAFWPKAEPTEATESTAAFQSSQINNKEGVGYVTFNEGTSQFVLSLSSDGTGEANKKIVQTVYGSDAYQIPCQLIVEKDGEPANEEFMALLEEVSVEITTNSGEPMEATRPAQMDAYPSAALVSLVTVSPANEECELQWVMSLKNGVAITIRQTIVVEEGPKVRYFADEYPMSTDEELDALLAQILEETPENTLIQLFLPAVTYEKPHTFADRSYQVLGAIEDENITVFRDTVTFSAENNVHTDIQNVLLEGSGTGVAVQTNVSTTMFFCTVQDWETGFKAEGRGTVRLEDCTFQRNQVGILWDSETGYNLEGMNLRSSFLDNGTALELRRVPSNIGLSFVNCTFSGNETDIQNDSGCPVDLSESTVE